jgi:hypothetical protein
VIDFNNCRCSHLRKTKRSNRAARRSEDLEQLINSGLLSPSFLRSVERATEAAGESKVVVIPKSNFQSSVTTHRESRNRSRMAIAQRAELAVNFRHQIFGNVVFEPVRISPERCKKPGNRHTLQANAFDVRAPAEAPVKSASDAIFT